MNRLKIKNFAAAESGVAAIEFAFIFPIMVLLFFCLIDFTGYVSYNRKVAAISGAVADLVSKNRNRVNADDNPNLFCSFRHDPEATCSVKRQSTRDRLP